MARVTEHLKSAALSWVAAKDVVRWERNPRRHPSRQIDKLSALMRAVGFVNPCVVWHSRRRLVSGHGRLDAVLRIEAETPGYVLPNAPGPAMVRVLEHEFSSDAAATAYALADNKLPELALDDEDVIAGLVLDIGSDLSDLTGIVFSDASETPPLGVETFMGDDPTGGQFRLEVSGPIDSHSVVLSRITGAVAGIDGVGVRAKLI